MKILGTLTVAAAIALSCFSSGAAVAQASGPHPPWFQSVTYFDAYGDIVGETRWYCDGRVVERGKIHLASYEEYYFYYECPA